MFCEKFDESLKARNQTMSLNCIPFEVFYEGIVPHIGVKELGSLAIVSKDLKDFCDDNTVWRDMYLRTIRCVITDKSVHTKCPHWGGSCDECEISKKLYSSRIVDDTGRLFPDWWCLPCLPEELKDVIRHPNPQQVNGNYPNDTLADRRGVWIAQKAFSEEIRRQWANHNRSLGLSTNSLCQNPAHYAYETLDKPETCRGSKCYKALVLSKLRTTLKNKDTPIVKQLSKKIREVSEVEKRILRLQGELTELKREETNIQKKYDKGVNGRRKITDAIVSIREKMKKPKAKKTKKESK